MAERLPNEHLPQRPVVLFPDPILRRKAKPVLVVDAAIRALVEDMYRVMDDEEGAGVAAPQVGESLRIFVTGTHERGVPRGLDHAASSVVMAQTVGDLDANPRWLPRCGEAAPEHGDGRAVHTSEEVNVEGVGKVHGTLVQ